MKWFTDMSAALALWPTLLDFNRTVGVARC